MSIGTSSSRMVAVNCGVPQGSVIGPLFYAIYTNELSEAIKSPLCQDIVHNDRSSLFGRQCETCGVLTVYADDLTLTVANKLRQENKLRITDSLENISNFLNDNFLAINLPKTTLTEVMISQKRVRTPGLPPSIVVRDGQIDKTVVDKGFTRILGANIERNMSWQSHLETGPKSLLPAVRRQLGHLSHIGKLIPVKSRLALATGLIVGRLNYLLPLWGGAAESHLTKAQIVLNAAARWATGLSKRTRISDLMDATGWLSVREQARAATAIQTWKLLHYGTPGKLLERMTINDDLTISVGIPRLHFSQDCYRWRATREWNELPAELRGLVSISAFKKKLKVHIRSQRGLQVHRRRTPD